MSKLTEKRVEALRMVRAGRIERGTYHGEPYWNLTRQQSFSDRVPTAALNWLLKEGYISLPVLFPERPVVAMLSDRGYHSLAVRD